MRAFFLLFLIVPIVEILLLFEVSSHIGALWTLLLVIITAIVGVQVLKRQGLSTFMRANEKLRSGQLPAQEMVEGLFLAVGGAFLLTPGFLTDTLGFLFLLPASRKMLIRALIKSGRFSIYSMGRGGAGFTYENSHPPEEKGVYEGEYTREQPEDSKLRDPDRD